MTGRAVLTTEMSSTTKICAVRATPRTAHDVRDPASGSGSPCGTWCGTWAGSAGAVTAGAVRVGAVSAACIGTPVVGSAAGAGRIGLVVLAAVIGGSGVAVLAERGRTGPWSPRPNGRVSLSAVAARCSVGDVLHGRDDERARLATLLDDARGGRAGTLLLHGEPGVGKSALLEDLVATAGSDVRVLRAQGVESEAPLPFAALHRLLRPVLGILDRLPAPQARALRAAFGRRTTSRSSRSWRRSRPCPCSPRPPRTRPCCASSTTRSGSTGPPPTRCSSPPGASARTGSRSCSPPATARATRSHPTASPPSPSTPLTSGAARALLAEAAGGALPDDVADRLMTQAAGNPLALVELPSALSAEQLPAPSRCPPSCT